METILGVIAFPFVIALIAWLPEVTDDEYYDDEEY